MGTLIKKITSDSSYLWLKTMKSEIYISGFPKKACQGCHISEGAIRIFKKLMNTQSTPKMIMFGQNILLGNSKQGKKELCV